jgi:ribonuclease R
MPRCLENLSDEELSDILREERMQRGCLDFDFPEAKVITDENRLPD